MANDMPTQSSEHGAVLVHTALALLALMAFSVFAIDFGVLWTARRQAQNAADAGALAGAIAIALDDEPPTDGGVAEQNALTVALSNLVWGQAPSVLPADVTFPACPENPTVTCIKVEVFRNTARGNPLPMFFGHLIGITQQDIQAVAMAEVAAGTATDCLKPFAVPDFYDPVIGIGGYSPPGYTLASHLGQPVMLKAGPPGSDTMSPGWFRLLDLAGSGAGGTGGLVGTNGQIKSCNSDVHEVGESLIDQHGNLGANVSNSVNDLYALDPGASFNGTEVVNSCADSGTCEKIVYTGNGNQTALVPDPNRTYSPRILLIPVFDPVRFFADGSIVVVNIFGFFVTQPMDGPPDFELHGILVEVPGQIGTGSGTVPGPAGFLKVVRLIR